MPEYLTQAQKDEIFEKFGGSKGNTGSIEGQVALFTHRIQGLSDHLKENNKDHSSRRALLTLVGKRRKLLRYLAGKDIEKYRTLVTDLGIRQRF